MEIPLKYAVVERERRFLVRGVPDGVVEILDVADRYVDGTRLRLREVTSADGSVVRKLTQKVRMGAGPADVACTNFYLDDAEWDLLGDLPGRVLAKRRHVVERDGIRVLVDEHATGTFVAEIDDAEGAPCAVPDWLDVIEDVSADESWTGAALAR